ncbi:MAG: hypothetical protein PHR53_01255 [Bacteroidales bacterium]|nr:hypothetical protein [Bacteroidales bacterium]
MKNLYFTFITCLLILMIQGCSKFEGGQSVPAYISIDSIQLQIPGTVSLHGITPSAQISDAWVYVDDILIGAFELPATFPVLHHGDCRITIRPGVLLNGINTTRERYPFYENFENNFILKEDSVTKINPVNVNFKPITTNDGNYYVKIIANENFEDINTIFDTMTGSSTMIVRESTSQIFSESDLPAKKILYNNWVGKISLDTEHPTCKIILKDKYEDMPIISYLADDYQAVFVEFDYLSNHDFMIGTETFYNTSGSEYNDFLGTYSNSQWKKLYVNLTNRIINDQNNNADAFKIYIIAELAAGETSAEIYIDNIRWMHFIK